MMKKNNKVLPNISERLWVRLCLREFLLNGGYQTLCIIFTVAVFYPGLMSPDSVDQYGQALTGKFKMWHPPIMSLVWSLLLKILPGPLGMLILHATIFWLGLDLAVAAFLGEERRRAIPWLRPALVIFIGLFPPVFTFLGVIWKDIALGASFLMALALFLAALRKSSRWCFYGGVVFLFYGIAVRHNAVLALPPMLVLIAPALKKTHTWLSHLLAVVASIFLCCAVFVTVGGISKRLAPGEGYPEAQIFIYDLAGISVNVGELRIPDYMRKAMPDLSVEALRRRYTTAWFNPLLQGHAPVVGTGPTPGFTIMASNLEEARALRSYWLHAIVHDWRAYLKHRLGVFDSLVAFTGTPAYTFHGEIAANPYGLVWKPFHFSLLVLGRYYDISKTFLYRGWIWLLVGFVVLSVFVFGRPRGFVSGFDREQRLFLIALCGSGLAYGLSYFVVTIASDFRYLWWPVLAAVVAVVLTGVDMVCAWLKSRQRNASVD